MGLIDSQAIDRAFRSGLMTDLEGRSDGLREGPGIGAGEAAMLRTKRLAGLANAQTAFETGRTLRLIARLFDQAGAPARITEQFRDNLGAAIVGEALRARSTWTRADTIDMFLDMYTRILDPDLAELTRTRNYLEDKAMQQASRPSLKRRLGGWLGKDQVA